MDKKIGVSSKPPDCQRAGIPATVVDGRSRAVRSSVVDMDLAAYLGSLTSITAVALGAIYSSCPC